MASVGACGRGWGHLTRARGILQGEGMGTCGRGLGHVAVGGACGRGGGMWQGWGMWQG